MIHPDRKRVFDDTFPSYKQESQQPEDNQEEEDTGRRSRWDSKSKIDVPGIPAALPATLAPQQIESYVLHMRLEEINRKLRVDDVMPSVRRRRRSPSPEPIYGADGKRVNTLIWRYRQKLEDERVKLTEIGLATIPGFRPSGDVRRSNKLTEKVFIPTRQYPSINFMGLLIGMMDRLLII